jgi:DNA-binding MarR family transcriptional regulator
MADGFSEDALYGAQAEDMRKLSTEDAFREVYTNFKLHFYREIFRNFDNREATLTTVESFCMEVIYAMKNPTINEFATFIQISSPNAAYKVNSLIRKGYLKKIQSQKDKREYYLKVTKKYLDYYNVSSSYVADVLAKVKETMTDDEWHDFRHVLGIISREQMTDVPTYRADRAQEIREIEDREIEEEREAGGDA